MTASSVKPKTTAKSVPATTYGPTTIQRAVRTSERGRGDERITHSLSAAGNDNDRYFFYDGTSQPESMVKSWDRVFKKVGRTADPPVANCHPHRFRDTFAVSLLLKGVALDSVSKLLGHSSIKVTERHYAPWVKARQEQLEAEVRRIWA
jgi:integrase